jgi:hypothetical protein
MTATNACTRHARDSHRERHTQRRPKAANDTNKANKELAAKPPPAEAVAPEGAGNDGGALSGTGTNAETGPDPTDRADPAAASQGENSEANSQDDGPAPTAPDGPGRPADSSTAGAAPTALGKDGTDTDGTDTDGSTDGSSTDGNAAAKGVDSGAIPGAKPDTD